MQNSLKQLIQNLNQDNLISFFRKASDRFSPIPEDYSFYLDSDTEYISDLNKIGEINFDQTQRLIVLSGKSVRELTGKSGKTKQYDIARKILKNLFFQAGIFVFHDNSGNFRFSFITAFYSGTKRTFSCFRRYTYFVGKGLPNKTFITQIGKANFSSLNNIQRAFSIEAVSEDFYKEFKPKFDEIAKSVQIVDIYDQNVDSKTKADFTLLFVIRIIFLGFVQKKGWLGTNEQFIQDFWNEYKSKFYGKDEFYTRWLEPLFFESLNSPPGRKTAYRNNEFSDETKNVLDTAPYLNGELFKRKINYDDKGLFIPDSYIGNFFDFLFQYNFTIEENTQYDEELELNPEFLGIIFENLVVKADGAVYTPRIEVDFMCRMALVKWLQKNSSCNLTDIYHLFFREGGVGADYDEDQKQGDFTTKQIRELISLLENITVCDPAAGSGAFEVGMLHVLNDIINDLVNRSNTPPDIDKKEPYKRKYDIIAKSLYGVEVKPWAVWINQLRLWLTLFIDMPDNMKNSPLPLLPSLNFKVRCGDSLVQKIGSKTFPVHGHANLTAQIKTKITELKKKKVDFFHNRAKEDYESLRNAETQLFKDIIDAEIEEKHKQLEGLARPKDEIVGDLFGHEDKKAKQLELKVNEETKIKLETEIAELEEEKKNLKDEHPLIWSIEFAEIFFDNGGFDIIIGNPPYVRQEDISDPNGILEPKLYKTALQEIAKLDFPSHFGKKVAIDGHSDLYTFFYLRSLHLLNEKGIHCFICSNSWLDVGYGVWLQYFLLRNVPVHFIFDNHAKRSFSTADVNTIISVSSAPQKKPDLSNSILKFVAFKKPFEDSILTENLLDIENARDILKNNTLRVYPVSYAKLLEEGTEYDDESGQKISAGKYIGDKWGGKYLRAPDIFFTILEKGKDKFVKLKDVADVRFGIKTGCNEFFYLTDEQARKWGIEEEFLKPVIKSPRECKSILINPKDLKYKIFMCNKSKEELKGTNALKYIEWGEQQEILIKQGKDKNKTIKGFNNLETVKNRKQWWTVEGNVANTFWIKETNERLAVFISNEKMIADCRLYYAILPIETQIFCNSAVYMFISEVLVRSGLGLGARSLMVYEVKNYLVLNSEFINGNVIIPNREIESVFVECGIDPKSHIPIEEQEPNPLPDRAELDKIVFDAIGLTEDERKEVYRAVCRLVWNRISKANSV